eukprot:scaffold282462_cov20-Prasinocladus_malaysianus.AAC.1
MQYTRTLILSDLVFIHRRAISDHTDGQVGILTLLFLQGPYGASGPGGANGTGRMSSTTGGQKLLLVFILLLM